MADWQESKDIVINASPDAVFDVVGDLARHRDLADSGELVAVRQMTDGPTQLGSVIEANEALEVGGQRMEFAARSFVVTFDPPRTISWVAAPPVPIGHIQWWFHLTPEPSGTRVVNEVEVDLGEEGRAMFGGVDGYLTVRAPDVAKGMAQTLQNLKSHLEA